MLEIRDKTHHLWKSRGVVEAPRSSPQSLLRRHFKEQSSGFEDREQIGKRQGEKREWKPTTKNEKQKNLPTAKLPMQQQEAKSECLENTELQTIDSLYLHLRTPTSHRITWAPRFSQCRTGADQHHFQPVFKSPTLDKDTPSSVKYLLCSVNELCYLMIAKQF